MPVFDLKRDGGAAHVGLLDLVLVVSDVTHWVGITVPIFQLRRERGAAEVGLLDLGRVVSDVPTGLDLCLWRQLLNQEDLLGAGQVRGTCISPFCSL